MQNPQTGAPVQRRSRQLPGWQSAYGGASAAAMAPPGIAQLAAYQQLANNSPQVLQLQAYQQLANNATIQRVLVNTTSSTAYSTGAAAQQAVDDQLQASSAPPLNDQQQERLNNLKEMADDPRMHHLAPMAEIVQYVLNGTPPPHGQMLDSLPSQTPPHPSQQADWTFDYRDEAPSDQFEMPQSPMPVWGEEEDRPQQTVDMRQELLDQRQSLQDFRQGYTGAKNKMGKNNYQYTMRADLRLEPMEEVQPAHAAGTLYEVDASQAQYMASQAQSSVYTSKLKTVPQAAGQPQTDLTDAIRQQLHTLRNDYNRAPLNQQTLINPPHLPTSTVLLSGTTLPHMSIQKFRLRQIRPGPTVWWLP